MDSEDLSELTESELNYRLLNAEIELRRWPCDKEAREKRDILSEEKIVRRVLRQDEASRKP